MISKETITDFVIFHDEQEVKFVNEDGEEQTTDVKPRSLWVQHEVDGDVLEYEVYGNSDGMSVFKSADADFYDSERIVLGDDFYVGLGNAIVVAVNEPVPEIWPMFMPENISDVETWAIRGVLAAMANDKVSFEFEELIERAAKAVGREFIDEVDSTSGEVEVPGEVVFFHRRMGYGFIEPEYHFGDDLFFYIEDLNVSSVEEGDHVVVRVDTDDKMRPRVTRIVNWRGCDQTIRSEDCI